MLICHVFDKYPARQQGALIDIAQLDPFDLFIGRWVCVLNVLCHVRLNHTSARCCVTSGLRWHLHCSEVCKAVAAASVLQLLLGSVSSL